MDKNNDGRLSKDEVKQGFHSYIGYQPTDKEVNEIFERCDIDHSGYIEYNEFIAGTFNKQKLFSARNLTEAFRLFDINGDGLISADEVMSILGTQDPLLSSH